jgi:hypothetical protein
LTIFLLGFFVDSTRSTVRDWILEDVIVWCQQRLFSPSLLDIVREHRVNGSALFRMYTADRNGTVDQDLLQMISDMKQR